MFQTDGAGEPAFLQHLFWLAGRLLSAPGLLFWPAAASFLILILFRRRVAAHLPAALFLFSVPAVLAAGWLAERMLAHPRTLPGLHDAYFIMVHRNGILMAAAAVGLAGLAYLLLERGAGARVRLSLAVTAWAGTGLALLLLYAPGLIAADAGMPQRYQDAGAAMQRATGYAEAGYYVALISGVVFAMSVADALWRRQRQHQARPDP